MNEENDENRKKTENFLPESNPGHWARFPSSVPTELRTHNTFAIRNVYKLNFGKDSTTNQTKPAPSTAKRVQSCRCEVCAVRRASGRGGRCVAGWLSVRGGLVVGARIVCDARADARGLVALARCAALYRMRCNALRYTGCDARCAANWLRCNALRCAALHGARIVCDTMRCARAGCIRAVQAAPCF
jgi:hypothetical protein